MSDTLGELDAAIQRHIGTAFEGAVVDHWFLVTHSQTLAKFDVSNYRIVTPDTQAIHLDAGLLKVAQMIVKDSWDSAYEEEDE